MRPLARLSLLLLLPVLAGCATPDGGAPPDRPLCPPLPEGASVSAVSGETSVGNGRFVEERDGWIRLVDAAAGEDARWAHWIQCSQVTTLTVSE